MDEFATKVQSCGENVGKIGGDDLLHLAMQLEERALSDDYFISRKISLTC